MKRKGRGGPWGGLWGGASAAWRVGSGDYGGEGGREMKWESWKGDTKWGGGYGVGITRGSCPPRPLSPPPFPHLQPCTMATSLRSSRWYHSVSCSRGPPSSVRLWGGDSSDTQPHTGPPSLSSPPPIPPPGPTCALGAADAAASPPHPGSPPCPPPPSPPGAQRPPPAWGHCWVPPPSAATPGSGEGGGMNERLGEGGSNPTPPAPQRCALTPSCARSSTCPPPDRGSHVSRVSASAASSWDRGRLSAPSACPPASCTWGGNGQQGVGRPP